MDHRTTNHGGTLDEKANEETGTTASELNAGDAVAPLWFQQWDQQHFQPFVNKVGLLANELDILVAQSANVRSGTGHLAPYDMVPFIDGSDPTAAPHNLPALRNISDIRALTSAESTRYCTNYGLEPEANEADRRVRIARHIGYYGPF
ncbi:hypothetical protein C8R44DRAFT_991242 [Mycena epipterygia]|nr:hypothetical protein C8R44DRAFT_991242 [Mycena epipterygia]